MPNESGAAICPNPKCHRKVEEPILLNDLSTTPPKQYHACPHCFVKLDENAENKEDVAEEATSGAPLHPALEKVLGVISTQPQKEKEEEEKKEERPVKPAQKEEKGASGCPYRFGYLANRPKNAPIPQECLTCPRIVDCMLKIGPSRKG